MSILWLQEQPFFPIAQFYLYLLFHRQQQNCRSILEIIEFYKATEA